MTRPTTEQSRQRYDILPPAIQDLGWSDQTTLITAKTCESQGLNPAQTSRVAFALGNVLFGFIKPEELAQEISTEASVSMEKASAISKELDERILSSVKNILAQIYSPLSQTQAPENFPLSNQPAPIVPPKEVKTAEPEILTRKEIVPPKQIFNIEKTPFTKDAPATPVPPPKTEAKNPEIFAPKETSIYRPQPAPQKPTTPTSGISILDPLSIKLEPLSRPAPTPTGSITSTKSATPTIENKKVPPPPQPNPTENKPVAENKEAAPMVLHEELIVNPIAPIGARVELGNIDFKSVHIKEDPRPAKLEIGGSAPKPEPTTKSSFEAVPARVVHYSEWNTPNPQAKQAAQPNGPIPLANLGGQNTETRFPTPPPGAKEISTPAPKPASTPTPATTSSAENKVEIINLSELG